jgi:hypothetical protein
MLIIVPVVIGLGILIVFLLRTFPEGGNRKRRSHSAQNAELIRVLLNLEDEPREQLFKLYGQQFGTGAARYARDTFTKWKAGTVRPNKETFRRFLLHLPKVMNFDLKCEVLREFREAYCATDNYSLTVYTDNWKDQLGPLVENLIQKANKADLPDSLRSRLAWLAEDDVEIANAILARSQEEQSRASLTLLDAEFANIEQLLDNAKGDRKVTHDLQLPVGTISLRIKRR